MSDSIGAMRARVTLQEPVRVVDEVGGTAIAFVDVAEIWAAIEATNASAAEQFDTQMARTSFRVVINRREARVGWRVLWGERTLRIVGVADDGAPRITLFCEEEMP